MAIACSTSAFPVPLDEALTRVAALGFSCVDLICIPGFGHIIPAELADAFEPQADAIEAALSDRSLSPVAVNVALGSLYQRDRQTNEARLRGARAVARLMERLQVRVASFYPGHIHAARELGFERTLQESVRTWHELLEIAAGHGLTFCVELHAQTPFETVEQGTRLLDAVPELSVAYDPSHFAMQEIPLPDTAHFLDRTAHVHVRDAAPGKMCVPFGAGTVDLAWLIEALAERDYRGHFSVEYLKNVEDPEKQVAATRAWLEEHLSPPSEP
jgi:sugar phosphate isomerase/epimerase